MNGPSQQSSSIHAIPLPTVGGTPARKGFNLQDHIAAAFCIRMLADSALKEIWCEAHDDIVIIWATSTGEEVEFTQVKSNELEQLWSIAKLCEQDDSKSGTSIIERSLGQHKCSEPCKFRIITARPVDGDLKILTTELEDRKGMEDKLKSLSENIAKKVKNYISPNGGDSSFWVHRTLWEEVHSTESVKARNLIQLTTELERLGHILLSDQCQELYQKLVKLVFDASLATNPTHKKLKRNKLLEWFSKTVNALTYPASVGGTKMADKMKSAGLASDAIDAAKGMRLYYRIKTLRERYSAPLDHQQVEAEVSATLNILRARLDAGELPDNGANFHRDCLDALNQLCSTDESAKRLGLAFLQGCMYSITDRCGHRFRAVTP
jgi:hypothetical protein